MTRMLEIGVLALQGDFAAHAAALERVGGCRARAVRRVAELASLDALILPGGESTTLAKLLVDLGLWDALGEFAAQGKPVFGTCAGLILMAAEVAQPAQASLGLLPVRVIRNAYGRQVDSFVVPGRVMIPPDLAADEILEARPAGEASAGGSGARASGGGGASARAQRAAARRLPAGPRTAPQDGSAAEGHRASFPAEFVFIRASRIVETRDGVEILASHEGAPVLVRRGPFLAASFHPELPTDGGVIRLFLALVRHARPAARMAP